MTSSKVLQYLYCHRGLTVVPTKNQELRDWIKHDYIKQIVANKHHSNRTVVCKKDLAKDVLEFGGAELPELPSVNIHFSHSFFQFNSIQKHFISVAGRRLQIPKNELESGDRKRELEYPVQPVVTMKWPRDYGRMDKIVKISQALKAVALLVITLRCCSLHVLPTTYCASPLFWGNTVVLWLTL